MSLIKRIFISYRHEDGGGYAGRLFDRLASHFGRERVFMDVDAIGPGEDFAQRIEASIADADVLIVLIGRQWLLASDAHGNRRLDDPADFVRVEILAALKSGIRVIPVLVEAASMPQKADLPEALAPLAYREAVQLGTAKFHRDVDDLIHFLDPQGGQAASTPAPVRSRRIQTAVLAGSLLLAAGLGYALWPKKELASQVPATATQQPPAVEKKHRKKETREAAVAKNDTKPRRATLENPTFTFPGAGEPNRNAAIGPFCCTGRTVTIRRTDGSIAGYVYFYAWTGQAYNIGKSSGFPTIDLLISDGHEQGKIQFDASEAEPGVLHSVTAGKLKFVARLVQVNVHRTNNPPLIDGEGLSIHVTVTDLGE